ncbi:MAG: nuclear transport factor 2 family protein [Bacteroidota bacterium]
MEPKFTLLLVFCLFFAACTQSFKPSANAKADEAAIRAILNAEQIAWNNGDLEAFMEGFWKSDSLQFMSPRGINHGWQEVLEGYKAGYPDRAAMGTLSYEVLKVTQLSEDNFVVSVKFHLTKAVGGLDGEITLIFQRIEGRWVAVYDHTS